MAPWGLGQRFSMSRGAVTAMVGWIEARGYAECIQEGFTEQEPAVIARFLTAITARQRTGTRGPA